MKNSVTDDTSKLRVILLTHSLRRGGAERNILRLESHLRRTGHQVDLVTLHPKTSEDYATDQNLTRITLDGVNSNGCIHFFRRIFELRKLILSENPDLIVSFLEIPNILTLIALGGSKIPAIISLRNHPDKAPISMGWKYLRTIFYPHADTVVTVSKQMASDTRKSMPFGQIVDIPNPVEARNKPGSRDQSSLPLILSIGRMEHQKGFDLLIRACKRLQDQQIHFRLRLVGNGTERKPLIELTQQLGIEHLVEFLPSTESPWNHYLEADVFVLSSRFEGFPNVLLEAMSFALPCISSDCRYGPDEIITHGENGWLVPPENVEALTDAIQDALSNPMERKRRTELASARLDRFEVPKIMNRWAELLHHVAIEGRSTS